MSTSRNNHYSYGAIPETLLGEDDHDDNDSEPESEKCCIVKVVPQQEEEEDKTTYKLSVSFQIVSGIVWCSMSLWGIHLATFYTMALCFDWNKFNTFSDLYDPVEYPVVSFAICFHLIGAIFMALAGAFQLVKYVRKVYPIWHRWIGRLYIASSFIVALGGMTYIIGKGENDRDANVSFFFWGVLFLICASFTLYYALQKNFVYHKLWAWRLYSLALGGWLYRFLYYWYKVYKGGQRPSDYHGTIDHIINWIFYVPGLVVVEIVFRWGETAHLPKVWSRILDVVYGVVALVVALFTFQEILYLWFPAVINFFTIPEHLYDV